MLAPEFVYELLHMFPVLLLALVLPLLGLQLFRHSGVVLCVVPLVCVNPL